MSSGLAGWEAPGVLLWEGSTPQLGSCSRGVFFPLLAPSWEMSKELECQVSSGESGRAGNEPSPAGHLQAIPTPHALHLPFPLLDPKQEPSTSTRI